MVKLFPSSSNKNLTTLEKNKETLLDTLSEEAKVVQQHPDKSGQDPNEKLPWHVLWNEMSNYKCNHHNKPLEQQESEEPKCAWIRMTQSLGG